LTTGPHVGNEEGSADGDGDGSGVGTTTHDATRSRRASMTSSEMPAFIGARLPAACRRKGQCALPMQEKRGLGFRKMLRVFSYTRPPLVSSIRDEKNKARAVVKFTLNRG